MDNFKDYTNYLTNAEHIKKTQKNTFINMLLPGVGLVMETNHWQDFKVEKAQKDVYNAVSKEYEDKLKTQANKFLEQTKILQKEIEAYEELVLSYEQEIKQLSSELDYYKKNIPNSKNILLLEDALQEIQDIYIKLKNLKIA